MTKNKTREGPLPPPDKGVNDARPGLPTPTIRKNVTWVQPEPTTSDITRPQQLSPDTTWAEPSTAKSKLARGPQIFSTTRARQKSRQGGMVRFKYVYWCVSHQEYVEPGAPRKLHDRLRCKVVELNLAPLRQIDFNKLSTRINSRALIPKECSAASLIPLDEGPADKMRQDAPPAS